MPKITETAVGAVRESCKNIEERRACRCAFCLTVQVAAVHLVAVEEALDMIGDLCP